MNEENSMNLDDRIGKETLLYGYIAISASTNRLSHNFNKTLKELALNGMMIPMNIREDDFYFTLSNMKKSHVNGAMLGLEYQKNILELLDDCSEIVQRCGACDFVKRVGNTLYGEFIAPKVVQKFVEKNIEIKKIAVIGEGALSRSLVTALEAYELSFYDTEVEKLLVLNEYLPPINGFHGSIDINHLSASGVDFSDFDLLIDTTMQDISPFIIKGAKQNLDLKESKNFSSLKQLPNYIGFDNLLDYYTNYLIEDLKQ